MIFIVSGPGGAGKGTVVQRVMDANPRLTLSRSWTTRARRPEEPPDAYVFVDRPTFEELVASGGFLEWTEFTGNLYGTPVPRDTGERDLVLEIELDGAQQIKRLQPDAIMIFLTTPTAADQEARLRGRGDDEASVARRMAVGRQEIELGLRLADYVVVNDRLDRAVDEVAGIIAKHQTGS